MPHNSKRKRSAWRLKKLAEGFCDSCLTRKARPNRAACAECAMVAATSRKTYQRSQLAKGMCINCAKPKPAGVTRCVACADKRKNEYRRRVDAKECTTCRAPATAGTKCFTHWMRVGIGASYGMGNANGLAILLAIWNEQDGRCAVTGEKMIPGFNASLDHITPRSKGGLSSRENLRWVLYEINFAKADMSHDEFVEMCRKVVRSEPVARRDASVNREVN